ncbi:hypothetical protein SAMN02745857_02472 [Andreprevotia lacus DSM 23236]|jgi:hypothetical protein|uniref:Uncharacterized protein n=1 Tax=Andreprevotia lacus DSM 23236 TaxID=1121001 RepID=A0A1W1XS90_9NEIS|nr:hypothetical protein [Andreprevotia lacus]SMC26388.1 hypothetical protein SAMN02745857_02472 [Andreprevotia lacus DSM 23236]
MSDINDPAAWFNRVSVDGSIYTTPELAVFASGCLLWVIAYVFVLIQARQYKVVEMAVLAGASNLAWEFVWGVLLHTDMGVFLVWTYRAWLFFDLFIFWQVLKLGVDQFTQPQLRHYYLPIVCGTVLFFIGVYWTMTLSGLDTPIGARSAYVCQFIISALCLLLLVQQPSTIGHAWTVTWLRSLGTLLVSVFMLLHYPHDAFLLWLCAGATVLDGMYCVYFLRLRKSAAQQPVLQAATG